MLKSEKSQWLSETLSNARFKRGSGFRSSSNKMPGHVTAAHSLDSSNQSKKEAHETRDTLRTLFAFAVVLFAAAMLFPVSGFAQATDSTIVGVVTDSTGSGIPGAAITANE